MVEFIERGGVEVKVLRWYHDEEGITYCQGISIKNGFSQALENVSGPFVADSGLEVFVMIFAKHCQR